MSQDNEIKRGFKRKPTKAEKIKCTIFSLLMLLFTLWVGAAWLLIFIVLIIDLYYTQFIPWTWWKNLKNPFLRSVMSWIDAIVFALVAVYILQNFFFQNYQIPTSSLEKTMLAGDYLCVSKAQYGPRVPMTPLSFPLYQHTITNPFTDEAICKSYLEKPQVKYSRMAGISNINRYDIVVFNYPAGDTVATKNQNDDYYRLKFHYGYERMHNDKTTFGDIIYRPVDRRENYVKRLVGMPGDSLQIINNTVFIEGQPLDDPEYLQHNYFIYTNGNHIIDRTWRNLGVNASDLALVTNAQVCEALGLQPDSITGSYNPLYMAPLTQEMISKLKLLKNVSQIMIVPAEFFGKDYVYPFSEVNSWTRSDYGPIWIPKAGQTIQLTPANVALYERCIKNYEGNDIKRLADGQYQINGQAATSYTFEMDYYWMMGDNRDNSADSRYWGFVPEDHIVGTPLFIWFSIDQETKKFRWDRLFKKVSGI